MPEAPSKPEVTAVDRTKITISWSPPKSDGGSPITGYIIEKKETSSTRWTKAVRDSVSDTTLTVKELIEGKEYEFRVAAVNKAGTGPFSEPSEPRITKPPYGKYYPSDDCKRQFPNKDLYWLFSIPKRSIQGYSMTQSKFY